MKTIIAGGRDFNDYQALCDKLTLHKYSITEVVCGGARGADALGKRWAEENNIPVKMFPARWNLHGRSAGMVRNVEMAEYSDQLIAFWDGQSPGTRHMIGTATALHLDVSIHRYGENK